MLMLLATQALAADIVDFSEDFDAYLRDGFSGTDGWVSSYASDPWSTLLGDGVYATTDDSSGTWGTGGAVDNHLVYTSATWSDFTLDATIHSDDDDTIGLTFRFQDAENFYLLFFVGGGYYPEVPLGASSTALLSGARLYKVELGTATLLASSAVTYTRYASHDVRVVAAGSALSVYVEDDASGTFDADDLILSATDAGFSDGFVGLYCYNDGEYSSTGCAFDDVVVSIPDTDADAFADEVDNCPDVANADQLDADGDGEGDACDADADGDGHDGTASGGADCDDTSDTVFPGATETCSTAYDDDCDGSTNDEGAVRCTVRYLDADTDTYGAATSSCTCTAASPYTALRVGDCDDATADVSPDGIEVCNGIDDDCDTTIDVGAVDATTGYADVDGDGYGDPGAPTVTCGPGVVADATDCDDTDATVFPGADERPNERDDNCDGEADEGLDTDVPDDTGDTDVPDDTGDTDVPDDTGAPDDTDEPMPRPGGFWGGAACDASGGASVGAWLGLAAALGLARRRA